MSYTRRRIYVADPISEWCCTFCGSTDNYMSRPGGDFAVQCCVCHARGPVCDTARNAIDGWEELFDGVPSPSKKKEAGE